MEDSIVAKRKPKPIRGMGIIADPDRRQRQSARGTRRQQQMRRAHRGRGGGWAGGGDVDVENFNDQVKRKYGGGKI